MFEIAVTALVCAVLTIDVAAGAERIAAELNATGNDRSTLNCVLATAKRSNVFAYVTNCVRKEFQLVLILWLFSEIHCNGVDKEENNVADAICLRNCNEQKIASRN